MHPTVIIPSMNPVMSEKARAFIPQGWPVIVKDGNPLRHFDELRALPIQTKWALNLDEDCFLIDPEGVLRLIDTMASGGYDTSGIQDGSSYMRQHNPVIFNPFFFIFDVAKLQASQKCVVNVATESQRFSHYVTFTDLPYQYDEFEPYYPFFMDLLLSGLKPLFLANHAYDAYDPCGTNLGKPSIVIGPDGKELAIHSWYSRLYHEPFVQERIRICEVYARAGGCSRPPLAKVTGASVG